MRFVWDPRARSQKAIVDCANKAETFAAAQAAGRAAMAARKAGDGHRGAKSSAKSATPGELITAAASAYFDAIIERCDPGTRAAAEERGASLFVECVEKSLGYLPEGVTGVVVARSACGKDEHRAGTHADYFPFLDVVARLTGGKVALVDVAARLTGCIRAGAPGAKGGFCAVQTDAVRMLSTRFIKFVFGELEIPVLGVLSFVATYDGRCMERDFGDCAAKGAVIPTAVVPHYRRRVVVARFPEGLQEDARRQNGQWVRAFVHAIATPLKLAPEDVYKCILATCDKHAAQYELPEFLPAHVDLPGFIGYGAAKQTTYREWHKLVETHRAGERIPEWAVPCVPKFEEGWRKGG